MSAPSDRDPSPTPWWATESTLDPLPPERLRLKSWKARGIGIAVVVGILLATFRISANAEIPEYRTTAYGRDYSVQPQAIIGGCTDRVNITEPLRPDGIVPSTLPDGSPFVPPSQITPVPVRGLMYAPPVDTTDQNFFLAEDPNAPSPFALLNNMWSGDVVLYYNPAARRSVASDLNRDLDLIRAVAAEKRTTDRAFRLIVAPWPTGDNGRPLLGSFPGDRPIAFAAWGNVQYCYQFVASALGEFREAVPVSSAPGADGTPPPVLPESVWQPYAEQSLVDTAPDLSTQP